MRVLLLLMAMVVIAAPAVAGISYDFVTTTETARWSERVVGRVWFDGDAYRAEVVRGGVRTTVISRDGDETAFVLNDQKQTWSNRSRVQGDVRSASLFLWPVAGAHVTGTPTITYSREEGIVVAAQPAVRHVISAIFDITGADAGMVVRGRFHVIATAWTAAGLPELPIRRPLRTGYPEVDSELAKIEANVRGLIVQHELEVTRQLDGGPAMTEKTTTVIERLRQETIASSLFEVPRSYQYVGPVTLRRD